MSSNDSLYTDIETCPEYKTFQEMPQAGQESFTKKFGHRVTEDASIDIIYEQEAALHAEFSKIVCIAVGILIFDKENRDNPPVIAVKHFKGDEKEIIKGFFASVSKASPSRIVAHNGKRFDYPFIIRRALKHHLELPEIFNIYGKKPWEVRLDDTVEIWKFTDGGHYASMITLCYFFDIPSPKQDIEGKDVPAAFWRGEIDRICAYCMQDVIALVHVHRRIIGYAQETLKVRFV